MPRRNRIDPWGDLHAVPERGLFTGNRGCLVDDGERMVRHHQSALWITCVIDFRGRTVPLAAPRRWTPLFFLDDAVAMAAGHRPCAYCRRADYRSYRDAVTRHLGRDLSVPARELNTRLRAERLPPGRGRDRAGDRIVWEVAYGELPDGAVVVDGGEAHLWLAGAQWRFAWSGWQPPGRRPSPGTVARVLTPPTSVAALANGFVPTLHPSAG